MGKIVEVKKFTPSLLNELVHLEKEAFGEGGLNEWTLPIVARYGRVFIFEKKEEIQGLAEFIRDWSHPEIAFLIGFSLKKKYQGRGLGKVFLEKILKNLREEGILRVRLTVSPKNVSALNLYRNLGFEEINFSPDEYGKGQDRLILETSLSPK